MHKIAERRIRLMSKHVRIVIAKITFKFMRTDSAENRDAEAGELYVIEGFKTSKSDPETRKCVMCNNDRLERLQNVDPVDKTFAVRFIVWECDVVVV